MDRKVKRWLFRDKKLKQAVKKDGKDAYSYIASVLYKVNYTDCLEKFPNGEPNIEGYKRRKIAKYLVCAAYFGDLDYLETVHNIITGTTI